MVALADVKRWNVSQVDSSLRSVQDREQILIHSGDDFLTALPVDGWQGPAADAAASAHQGLVTRLDHFAAGVAIIAKTMAQISDAIPAVQREIANAEELASHYGYRLEDDGQITDILANPGPNDPSPQDRALAKTEVSDMVAAVLRTAGDIDNDLASVLKRAAAGDFGTGTETTVQGAAADGVQDPGEVLTTPPKNGTPSQNAAWWDSLSAAGQQILERDHPDWLGNLDGLPGSVRSAANVTLLPRDKAILQAQLDDAAKEQDSAAFTRIEQELASLDAISTTMKNSNRQLLTLDITHDRVEAAVAVGNIDTAEHVAVFTPGFTTTVNGDLKDYDADMNSLQALSQNISNTYGDGGGVATVTWIGYQAPQWGGVLDPSQSVASDATAKVGAASLDGFLDGIGASHDVQNQPLQLTELGHSYGSLTTGIALQQQTPVHNAVVFGSPGMDINNVQQLKVPAGHVYSEWAGADPVPDLDVTFGKSPYGMLGIDQISTAPSTGGVTGPTSGSYFHGEYLDSGTTSQYNMATIIGGRPDLRIDGPQPQPNSDPSIPTIPPGVPSSPPPTPPAAPTPAPPGPTPTPPPTPTPHP